MSLINCQNCGAETTSITWLCLECESRDWFGKDRQEVGEDAD